ncbi:GNAT family N-acetyltransferase [Micrococcus sp.]|uniref:GNAT family N-acetyltransferase n=1 Tax=Micrococcus sp. TaxID=1271 RepID=UPI002A9188F4|nr:GNAT family N-acetyltransferase [Micrococcus sp.]MDY6055051.1 GNAT family N-acetyltransferase [Micrococcus sp.]
MSAEPRPSRPLLMTLRPGGADDAALTQVADILAQAFLTDPYTLSTVPPTRRRQRLAERFARMAQSCLHHGAVDMAVDPDDGTVLAAALWDGPEAPRGVSVPGLLAQAPWLLRVHGRRTLDQIRTDAACEQARPNEPHWYLKDLGTLPAARGRGAASAIVRRRQRDAGGRGIYLESSTRANVPFYEHLGLQVLGDVPAPGAPEPLTGMWWAP